MLSRVRIGIRIVPRRVRCPSVARNRKKNSKLLSIVLDPAFYKKKIAPDPKIDYTLTIKLHNVNLQNTYISVEIVLTMSLVY